MIAVRVASSSGAYDVCVGPGVRARLAALPGRRFVVADERVLALHGAPDGSLVIPVPPGEASKSLAEAERLWSRLVALGATRSDTLVAYGGGVVGDLAGFVAATYHRGMPFVQLPTTLLAQVDSSVGGKVAIDLPLGKNLIGAFHAPRLVLADTELLATLPARERWSGLAEVAKAALILDPSLLERLERDLERIADAPDPETIARAVRLKAEVVAADEREDAGAPARSRRILNFGHTVGHGLEAATGYGPLTHGEAVVLGMRAALRLSPALAGLPAADAERALRLLDRFPVPKVPRPPVGAVLEAMRRDKKAEGGRIRFVALRALGAAVVVPAGEDVLASAIERAFL